MRPATWAVVVAAGSGTRFGGAKQFTQVAGRSMLERAVESAASVAQGIVVVLPSGVGLPDGVAAAGGASRVAVAAGGATRSGSVRAGLGQVPADAEIVVVHDAARPLATAALFAAVVDAVAGGADAALPCVEVTDTLKRVEAGDNGMVVRSTVERSGLAYAQTPQAFRAAVLRRVHVNEPEATDDAGLVEAAGGLVVGVAGDADNVKITSPADLARAERSAGGAGGMRVGQGYDVHRFASDATRPLVLGGVTVPGATGLDGHSDADVVAHAVADAILGAAGLGDLGAHFPDSDARWAGADSIGLLGEVVRLTSGAGWRVVNVDCTVVARAPRLAPHVASMRARLSEALGAPASVKATTTDGVGALGRGEGIACSAIALLARS